MPGPFRQWRGAASFVDGWLNQDREQQKMQLEFLESIAKTAATTQDISGRQAQERRAESLFPGQMTQQGLTTDQMAFANREAEAKFPGEMTQQGYETEQMGFETETMQRSSEQQAELDALILDKFGLPSYEVFKYYVDAGKLDELNRMSEEMRRLNAPELEAELGVVQKQQTLEQAQAYGGRRGPESAGIAQAIKDEYDRGLAERRLRGGLAGATAKSEIEQLQLAPELIRAQIYQSNMAAKAALARTSQTPAGKDDLKRQAFIDVYGGPEGLKRYANSVVYGAQQEAGQVMTMPQIQSSIEEIELAIWRLEQPNTTDPMATAMLAVIMESNPRMFGDVSDKDTEELTKDEIKALLKPRLDALNILHAEADPEGRSYMDLTGGKAATGEPTYSVKDIDAAIGILASEGTDTASFSSNQSAGNSKNYLLKIMKGYRPDQWEAVHQTNRPMFISRSSEQDWNATLEVIRQLAGNAGGGQQ